MNFRFRPQNLKSQRGMTVTELMIAVGIGGVVMAAIASGLTATFNMRQRSDQKTEASLIYDRLTMIVAKKEQCKTTVGDLPFTAGAPMPMTLDGMSAGKVIKGGLTIKDLSLIVTNPSPVVIAGGQKQRYSAAIRFQTEANVGSQKILSKPKMIPLRVVVKNGAIESCSNEVDKEDLCLDSGGTWDATGPEGLKCIPSTHCQYAGSYSDAPASAGGWGNNALSGSHGCPAGFTASRSGTMSYTRACGKVCAETVTQPTYNCVRCGPTLAANRPADPIPPPNSDLYQEGMNEVNEAEAEQERVLNDLYQHRTAVP